MPIRREPGTTFPLDLVTHMLTLFAKPFLNSVVCPGYIESDVRV